MKYFILCTLILTSIFQSGTTVAHEEAASDLHNMEKTMELFQKAVYFTSDIVSDPGVATPSLHMNGKKIYLNSAFWTLVRGWIQLYHQEILRDCPECMLPSEDVLLAEAQDLAARGFFKTKVFSPLGHSVEHIALETADLGARLGTTALIAKVASEVAETVGSKFVGGAGVHIFCNAIDAAILFGTRHLQTFYRVPRWSYRMGASSLPTSFRYFAAARAIRRAQKRVQFHLEPFEVDEEVLKLVDGEGQNRWWGYVSAGKRSRWIHWLDRKSSRLRAELVELKARPDFVDDRALQDRSRTMELQIQKMTQISKKKYLGSRYKRFLFLKARKRGVTKHLKGTTPIDQALNKNLVWIGAVQENILNRSLIPESPESQAQLVKQWQEDLNQRNAVDAGSVVEGLAQEMMGNWPVGDRSEDLKIRISELLREIGEIYNPAHPASLRYLKVLMVENLLGGLAYDMMKWKTKDIPTEHHGFFGRVWELSQMRWVMGRYVKYVFEYGDFLRLSAASKNSEFLISKKYEAIEAFMRIFKHLQNTSTILDQDHNAHEISGLVGELNRKLLTFKPWMEKRQSYSWIPFVPHSPPRCEQLSLVGDH